LEPVGGAGYKPFPEREHVIRGQEFIFYPQTDTRADDPFGIQMKPISDFVEGSAGLPLRVKLK